jgi:hypothetical protein
MRNLIVFIGCILYIVLVSCKKDKEIMEESDEEHWKGACQ